jgi:hypothetical protein
MALARPDRRANGHFTPLRPALNQSGGFFAVQHLRDLKDWLNYMQSGAIA